MNGWQSVLPWATRKAWAGQPLFLKFKFIISFWRLRAFIAVRGLSLVVAHGLLIAVASPVAEHRLWVMRARWCVGFVALWHVESSQTRD